MVNLAGTFGEGSLLSNVADLADYVQLLWNTYVVGLNADRQNQIVYKPLAKAGHALERSGRIHRSFSARPRRRGIGSKRTKTASDRRGWYLAALGVLAVCLFLLRRRVRCALGWMWSKRPHEVVAVSPLRICRSNSTAGSKCCWPAAASCAGETRPRPEFARFAGHQAGGGTGLSENRGTLRSSHHRGRAPFGRLVLSDSLRPCRTGQPPSRSGRTGARPVGTVRRQPRERLQAEG